jgi:hypothetical protein
MNIPTLDKLITTGVETAIGEIFTASVGQVVSFDPSVPSVEVQPMIQRETKDKDGARVFESMPVLTAVPILFFGGGGFRMTLPLDVGDTGLLVFAMHDLAAWLTTGQISQPGDAGRHHPSFAIFLPGLTSWKTPIPAAAEPAFVLEGDDLRLGTPNADDPPITKSALDAAWLELTTWIATGNAPSGGGTVVYADPPPDAPEGDRAVKMQGPP